VFTAVPLQVAAAAAVKELLWNKSRPIGPAFRSKYTEEASLGLVRRRRERRVNDGSKSPLV
jgi:hypothetical protein